MEERRKTAESKGGFENIVVLYAVPVNQFPLFLKKMARKDTGANSSIREKFDSNFCTSIAFFPKHFSLTLATKYLYFSPP
jgi:hypothetical protein